MPSSAEILRGLAELATGNVALAVLWHFLIGTGIVAAWLGHWQPTRRIAALSLVAPLASVALLAWSAGNPFNGVVMTLAAAILLAIAVRLEPLPMRPAPLWAIAIGVLAIAYGWVYPHFLADSPAIAYFVAAPVGIVPCPTLAIVAGFSLVGNGFESRAWSLTVAALGIFYALFGALRLGVWLDAGLLLAAIAMLLVAFRLSRRTAAFDDTFPAGSRGYV